MASIPGRHLRDILDQVPSIQPRHAFELAAVFTGAKPVARVVVKPDELDVATSMLTTAGFDVAQSDAFLGVESSNTLGDQWTVHVHRDDPRATYAVVFAARAPEAARHAARQEAEADAEEIGLFLGYPACCVRNYARIEAGSDWLSLLLQDHLARKPSSAPLSHLTNKVSYLFDGVSLLPDYFPCSLHCPEARHLASRMHDSAIECGLSDLVNQAKLLLKRPIAIWHGLIIQPVDAKPVDESHWTFGGETALRFDWQPARNFPLSFLDHIGGWRADVGGLWLLHADQLTDVALCDPDGVLLEFH